MPLFRIKGKTVVRVAPSEHRIREDVIHKLIEENLLTCFADLMFVARKPRIGGKEFDTLGLDRIANVPVIVEYKREKDRNVVEQVDLYYVKLKHNKSDVMVRFQKEGGVEDLEKIDFDNPQIIIVAKEFTPEQRELLTLKGQYLRLFRYQLYDGGILTLEEVEPLGPLGPASKKYASTRRQAPADYAIDHFGMSAETKRVHEGLDDAITSLDSRVKPGKVNKYFIGYGATGTYFCCIKPRVNSIRVEVKCSHKPTAGKSISLRRVPEYQHTPMTHTFEIRSEKQIPAASKVIKAALEDSM